MFDITDIDCPYVLDPSTSLMGAKQYLAKAGFADGFGQQETINAFNKFAAKQTEQGSYACKSTNLGLGGRAALLKHHLIISGKYGDTLDDIDQQDWSDINKIARIRAIQVLRHGYPPGKLPSEV